MNGTAFDEGKRDHARGLPQSACAYTAGTAEFEAWNQGWGEAMSIAAYVSAPVVGASHQKQEAEPAARLLGIV